jgi:serine O-acetyltransferase
MGLCRDIYLDYRRYRAAGGGWFSVVFLTQGFWASSVYRFSRWAWLGVKVPVLRRLLRVFLAVLQKAVEVVTGISLPPECEVGEGLYIGHFGPIIFPRHGRIGSNCNVQQGVTFGVGGRGDSRGAPVIGDRVHVGPNAVVIGNITVGNDAVISSLALVTKPVPPRAVVMGNPARVVSYAGSFDFIRYDAMHADPGRLASIGAEAAPGAADGAAPEVPMRDPVSCTV